MLRRLSSPDASQSLAGMCGQCRVLADSGGYSSPIALPGGMQTGLPCGWEDGCLSTAEKCLQSPAALHGGMCCPAVHRRGGGRGRFGTGRCQKQVELELHALGGTVCAGRDGPFKAYSSQR